MKPTIQNPVTFLGHAIAWDEAEGAYAVYDRIGPDGSGPLEPLHHATSIDLCVAAIAEVVEDGEADELAHDCTIDGCVSSSDGLVCDAGPREFPERIGRDGVRNAADLVEVLRVSFLTREGETITEELAQERARNAACGLVDLLADARLGRQWREAREAEAAKLDAERAIGVAAKRCHIESCPPAWTCRDCGARCCEHRASFKKPDGTATCGACQAAKA